MTKSRLDAEQFTRDVEALCPQVKWTRNAPMSQFTTLRLGGPADLLAEPESEDALGALLRLAHDRDVPMTVIGQGSDLVVLDGGIRGLVIRVAGSLRGVTREGTRLAALAGTSLAALSQRAAEEALAGLCFAGGIPGSVGGGVFMNAGAYGGEMSQVLERARGFTRAGEPVELTREELRMGYRHSALQETGVVLSGATFCLAAGDAAQLKAEMAELRARRSDKQPLNYPSAGSTFKRPEGHYAAALIEQCGLKGVSIGGAQVSEKHAGFLLNRGGTARDFLALIAHVQAVVAERTGVRLETEVRILGEETGPEAI